MEWQDVSNKAAETGKNLLTALKNTGGAAKDIAVGGGRATSSVGSAVGGGLFGFANGGFKRLANGVLSGVNGAAKVIADNPRTAALVGIFAAATGIISWFRGSRKKNQQRGEIAELHDQIEASRVARREAIERAGEVNPSRYSGPAGVPGAGVSLPRV